MVNSDTQSVDIAIIGGGLVGASLACALGKQGHSVAVVEARPIYQSQAASFDERTLALSFGSAQIFASLGLWSDVLQQGISPIESIHVSDQGFPGKTRLQANEAGVDALGYVVPMRILGSVLKDALAQLDTVKFFCPASLSAMTTDTDHARLSITTESVEHELHASLVVGADGADSVVRQFAGIQDRSSDYQQSAVIANISSERAHRNVAYERFTRHGPLAMLPLPAYDDDQHRSALVWTVPTERVETVMAYSDEEFLAEVMQDFGMSLGRLLKTGKRHAFPLSLRQAQDSIAERVALIGNAAHTLHPIAGQGFNLGLRDVAVLAQVVVDALRAGRDPGLLQALQLYADWQQSDQQRVIGFTDSLVRAFSNRLPPLAFVRNMGMFGAEIFPSLKQRLAKQAMGVAGKLPRLARGLPL